MSGEPSHASNGGTTPPPSLRVLLIEDSPDDAVLVLEALQAGGYQIEAKRVETREAVAQALAETTWDLILCDFNLPRFGAPEALSLCSAAGIEAPLIIVSGSVSEEDAVECMRAGAHDFVTKGRFARLAPAVDRGLREVAERRARRRLEDQLRQAQKMEAIGQLAGGVAHDFNNLLGVAMACGELLLKELGNQDPRRRRVEQILAAVERGAALTRQLLAFGRRQVLQPSILDMNDVVGDTEKMLRRLIPESVEVVTLLGADLGHIKADRGQIEQVILNLAVNGRDAMPQGGRLIIETANVDLEEAYTRTHAGVRPGAHVMLAVSDTGHGMDAATLEHLFEPFFTTKEPGKGTGLGLATVYGIVKQTGGHVAVYSEPGHGSTFKVYLPRCDEAGAALPPAAPEVKAAAGSETVLLLEDESALREVIQELLESSGYTVLTGPTPHEALNAVLAGETRVDLLLTDVVMPRINGREAAARLLASQPRARVLFMSGYTNQAAGEHGVLDPAANFLQKPFTGDALLRKMRQLMDTR